MKVLNIFHSFRVRFVLVLAGLLFATLAVQYIINVSAERKNEQQRETQERALIAGVSLGVRGITSTVRLTHLREGNPQFDEVAGRVLNVIIVDDQWKVFDSLREEQWPELQADGVTYIPRDLKDIVIQR